MFRRGVIAVLTLVVALLATSMPAWAHEEISPNTLPTGRPTFFTLSAANEKTSNLVKVVLTAPKGVPLGTTTAEPQGWEVTKTDTTVSWTAPPNGGVLPAHFAQWGFETDGADQPGSFSYQIDLTYADGSHGPVEVPVTVTAATNLPGGKESVAHASQGRANAALVMALIGIILGLAALAIGLRRRPNVPATDEAGQDW